jgi:hypothetical protein
MKASTSARTPTLEKHFFHHWQQESATRVKDWYSVLYAEPERVTGMHYGRRAPTFTATARPATHPAEAAPPARTELGRRLRALREQIVASGERLLDWDELEQEIAERRGE